MGKRRRTKNAETDQKSFWFVFTTEYSQFHLPRIVSLPRLKFLEKKDEEAA